MRAAACAAGPGFRNWSRSGFGTWTFLRLPRPSFRAACRTAVGSGDVVCVCAPTVKTRKNNPAKKAILHPLITNLITNFLLSNFKFQISTIFLSLPEEEHQHVDCSGPHWRAKCRNYDT
jgi:hypothetical protein